MTGPERSSAPVAAAPMDLPTAAAYTGVAIAVLARAIHRREIPFHVAAGGALYVDRTALESWAADCSTGS
jgi:hypothetical protein